MVNAMPGLRSRKHRSGKTYYYFDTGTKGEKEIPLGSNHREAVKKWIELSNMPAPIAQETFADLADRYEAEVIPGKAKSTQQTQRGDLRKLREFFCNPTPAPLNEIKPKHVYLLLQWAKDTPTTANRLKRTFSHMFNMARAWGWTENENPCTGIEGHALGKREVYITDEVFRAVYAAGSDLLKDAMDLAYLTGQRPSDVRDLSEHDIKDGHLVIKQSKTSAPLRFVIEGALADLLARLAMRKAGRKLHSSNLLTNNRGGAATKITLRRHFEEARASAAAAALKEGHDQLATEITAFWFYDLRAKAADDVADDRGEQAASKQLGHASVSTTKRHYLRRGPRVGATK
ncbi:tyrosine-type recombinase/integrase [Comamonas terrigena]|uniref:tyrosine-type recombinase/integrase n=1 Tax=Comamonas terrigena TaxID=32013 RepID=UPI002355949D|nr:tyrosine-type recombinase/integrase [Comamonas terrigena]